MIEYSLMEHPTVNPMPIGIYEMVDGKIVRCVAILKGEAHATRDEARIMLKALRAAQS